MSVTTQLHLTYDVHVSPEKRELSVLVDKPVKYATDPNKQRVPFEAAMPDIFILHGPFAFFRVNGYLSHCLVDSTGYTDKSDLDLMHVMNTHDLDEWAYGYGLDSVGRSERARKEWIATLLSDFDLNGDIYRSEVSAAHWTVHTVRHQVYGIHRVHVLHQKSV